MSDRQARAKFEKDEAELDRYEEENFIRLDDQRKKLLKQRVRQSIFTLVKIRYLTL